MDNVPVNWLLPPPPPAAHPGTTWVERMERASRTKADWEARCAQIRVQILTTAGLWPEFEAPPVKAEVYGKAEKDGYSVEKVRLETWPGFLLTGNLYRPSGKKGRLPGILSLHGHWEVGRFADEEKGSQPGRALGLARMGFVVFTYDMVGYGDLTQVSHKFGDVPWGLSVLGLQLWNSMRAIDFLASLPDVDPARIGVTGESGGGTQTFMLGAVDPRVAVSIPVNMVTGGCQGGCLCENAPLMRLDLNNMEIAAAVAPRPLMLITCTGDWTADVPKRDAPAVQRVYAMLGVPERFRVVQVDADHNYNKDSREMAYAWLAQWLQGAPKADRITESPFKAGTREELTVWDREHPKPAGLLDDAGLDAHLRGRIREQLSSLWPVDAASLERFRGLMLPAMRYTLAARFPLDADIERAGAKVRYKLLPGELDIRDDGREKVLTVVTAEDARRRVPALGNPDDRSSGRKGRVLVLGHHHREVPCNTDADTKTEEWIRWRESHPLTYYRTEMARQVQDILTAVAAFGGKDLMLEGSGDAGVAVLLARSLIPADKVGKTVVDLTAFDELGPDAWTGERTLPGILRIGGLRTAAILCAPGELELKGAWKMDFAPVRAAYRAAGKEGALVL